MKSICYLLWLQYIGLYFCISGDSSESIEYPCSGDFVYVLIGHVGDSFRKCWLLEAGIPSFARVINYCIRTCPRNGLSVLDMTKRKSDSGHQHLRKTDPRSEVVDFFNFYAASANSWSCLDAAGPEKPVAIAL